MEQMRLPFRNTAEEMVERVRREARENGGKGLLDEKFLFDFLRRNPNRVIYYDKEMGAVLSRAKV